jgi:hypothetical protein
MRLRAPYAFSLANAEEEEEREEEKNWEDDGSWGAVFKMGSNSGMYLLTQEHPNQLIAPTRAFHDMRNSRMFLGKEQIVISHREGNETKRLGTRDSA